MSKRRDEAKEKEQLLKEKEIVAKRVNRNTKIENACAIAAALTILCFGYISKTNSLIDIGMIGIAQTALFVGLGLKFIGHIEQRNDRAFLAKTKDLKTIEEEQVEKQKSREETEKEYKKLSAIVPTGAAPLIANNARKR